MLPLQEFTATGVKRDEKLDTALKAAYKYKNILTAATFNTNGKVCSPEISARPCPLLFGMPLHRSPSPISIYPVVRLIASVVFAQVTTSVTASEVAPGLSVSLVGTVPDIQTAKVRFRPPRKHTTSSHRALLLQKATYRRIQSIASRQHSKVVPRTCCLNTVRWAFKAGLSSFLKLCFLAAAWR